VVRVPKRRICARALEKELELLDVMHREIGEIPVEIPRYEWRIDAPATLALPYAIYRYLEGRQLYRVRADRDVVARTARALGAFLRRLHALEILPRRRFVDQFAGHLHEFRKHLEALGDALPGRIHAAFSRLLASPYPRYEGKTRVCHADLLTEHVLVADDAVAVIDWGDARLDDPWSDFVGLWTWAGDRGVHVAAEAYGEKPSAADWHRIRFKGACVTLGQCYYGKFGGNDTLFRSSLADLSRMLHDGQIDDPSARAAPERDEEP
jgi:aminoglycoside phosphotransferase (APT) family kinase protein